MTRTYRVKKRADELKLGDFYVGWILNPDPDAKPNRILDIKVRKDCRIIVLDDLRKYTFKPEHLVLVEVLA